MMFTPLHTPDRRAAGTFSIYNTFKPSSRESEFNTRIVYDVHALVYKQTVLELERTSLYKKEEGQQAHSIHTTPSNHHLVNKLTPGLYMMFTPLHIRRP
jgi:hypothetical protein